jgi:glutamate synthase (ferredoxin)
MVPLALVTFFEQTSHVTVRFSDTFSRPRIMSSTTSTSSRPGQLGLPAKQGLYDPFFEHDACGVGFVVDNEGAQIPPHLVEQAVEVLVNLDHRGAAGSEVNTGDGAGILIQIPHKFFAPPARRAQYPVPEAACTVSASPSSPRTRHSAGRLEEVRADLPFRRPDLSSDGAPFR